MNQIQTMLDRSAQRHSHLCPRQVLGVRMGMLAGEAMGLDLPQKDKRLFTFAESDGCGTGGISVATGCWLERRTLRVMDFGKMAATFVDTQTGRAIRISPEPANREKAQEYVPEAPDLWHSMLEAYQIMPDEELFIVQSVQLKVLMEKIISQPGLRVACEVCGEEISNEREVMCDGLTLCRYCAGERYYESASIQQSRKPVQPTTPAMEFKFHGNGKIQVPVDIGVSQYDSNDIHSISGLIEKSFQQKDRDLV